MDTSGSLQYSTSPFTDAEKTDLRRFMGYSAYGPGATGFQGWRFFQAYGLMEYRMNNAAPAEIQVVRQYLSQLYDLESAIPATGGDLDTLEAAVWKWNPNEVRDRMRLFDNWRRRLCRFWGVPPGPDLQGGDGTLRLVV
jgi:hypothetical protein